MIRTKRSWMAALCLALLVMALVFNEAITVEAQSSIPDATTAIAQLRVRTAPSVRANTITMLPKGTTITVSGRDASSQWLYGTTSTQVTGWVSKPYLSLRNSLDIATLPVKDGTAPTSAGGGSPDTSTNKNNASAAAPAAPVTVAGNIGGALELGGQVGGLDGNTVSSMKRAGMRWVKFQLGVGDGTGAIQAAKANGFKVLLSVKGDKNRVLAPGYFNEYAGYVGTLAGQGADAIEVWNEANLDREWPYGKIDPGTYTQLLASAYNAIKKNNAGTIVISGAPAPTGGAPGGKSAAFWNDDVFMAGMAAAGAGKYSDCIGLHYNEGIVSPNQSSGGWINYPTNYFDSMLARGLANFPGKKACFTELGYLSAEGFGPLPQNFSWAKNVTVAQQAAWLAQAAVKSARSGRVRLMIVWNVNFSYYGPDDPMGGYAIMRPNGTCPACDTLGQVSK